MFIWIAASFPLLTWLTFDWGELLCPPGLNLCAIWELTVSVSLLSCLLILSLCKSKRIDRTVRSVRPVILYCIMTNDFLLAAVVRNPLNTKTLYRTEASDLNASAWHWSVSIWTLYWITEQEIRRASFKLALEGYRLYKSWQNDIDGDVLFKAGLCNEQLLCLQITGGCLCYEVIKREKKKEVEKHLQTWQIHASRI